MEEIVNRLDSVTESGEKIKLMDELKPHIKDDGVAKKVCELLVDDPDRFVRIKATELLEEADGRDYIVEALVKGLKGDEDPFVRGFCAKVLGRVGNPSVIPALEEALKDSDGFVRDFAAGSLKVLQMRARLFNMMKQRGG